MIGKMISRFLKGNGQTLQVPAVAPAASVAPPDSHQDPMALPDPPNWDTRTVIRRAELATLAIGGHGSIPPRVTNAFDVATVMMRPGASDFEPATIVANAHGPATRTAPNLPLPTGTVLNGRYEIIKPIGRGGFSFVYLCQHQRNGRLNAVKEAYGPECGRSGTEVVTDNGASLQQAKHALLREVSAISRINHPGIVRFEDVFEANGTLCFAMDFVEGEPLSGLLARRRGVSADTFAKLAMSLLDAVESLHANDVLHGDIKPGNIILRSDKSVVIIDFGTAARLTDMHYVEPILTPGYSAPERYVPDGDVGAWSDVYSCAATLIAAMAGRPPPVLGDSGIDQSDMAAFLRAAGEKFPDSARWCTGAELGLREDAHDRPASIADLRTAMGLNATTVDAALGITEGRADGRSVFVSYAHSDADVVEKLVRAIQRRGAGVWIDRQGIKPGSRAWGNEILKGMRGAEIVLLFSSLRSMASDNVRDEIYLAKELRKPIVVGRLDQTPFNDEILMFLTRSQHIPALEMEPPEFAAAIIDALYNETARPA